MFWMEGCLAPIRRICTSRNARSSLSTSTKGTVTAARQYRLEAMSVELSKSQVNRLGERLRKGKPLPADIEILDTFRRSFDEAQQIVTQRLRDLGLEPSVRIKTTISIVEKLKRESIRLSK